MNKRDSFLLSILLGGSAFGQRTESIYLNATDSTANRYVMVLPAKVP